MTELAATHHRTCKECGRRFRFETWIIGKPLTLTLPRGLALPAPPEDFICPTCAPPPLLTVDPPLDDYEYALRNMVG